MRASPTGKGTAAKNIHWLDFLVAALLGFAVGAAIDFRDSGTLHFTPGLVACALLAGSVALLCLVGFKAVLRVLSRTRLDASRPLRWLDATLKRDSPMGMALLSAVMLACWLPVLALMYPGNLSNDTTGQLGMYFSLMDDGGTGYPMSDHHPVFDTFLFGAIIYPFAAHGQFHLGLFCCLVLQELFTALALAYSIRTASRRWGAGPLLCLLLLMFAALLPLYSINVASLSKDTFFSWLYVFFFTMTVDLAISRCDRLHDWKYALFFVAVCLLLALSKKFGVYVVIGSTFILALFSARGVASRLVAALALVLSAALMFVAVPAFNASMGIKPGSAREMLAIPAHQSALLYVRDPGAYTEAELDEMDEMFDPREWDRWFRPFSADNSKGMDVKDVEPMADFEGYLEIWKKKAGQYPTVYLDAWATLESPLYTYSPFALIIDSSHHDWNRDYLPESYFAKDEPFASFSASIADFYAACTGIPVIGLLFQQGLYAILLPAFLLVCLLESPRRWRLLPAYAPILVSLLGLAVSPTVDANPETTRYLLPFLYTTPAMLLFARYALNLRGSARKRPSQLAGSPSAPVIPGV